MALTTREDVKALFDRYDTPASVSAGVHRGRVIWALRWQFFATAAAILVLALVPKLEKAGWLQVAQLLLIGAVAFKFLVLVALRLFVKRARQTHHTWTRDRMRAELCRAFLAVWHVPREMIQPPFLPDPVLAPLRDELEAAWRASADNAVTDPRGREGLRRLKAGYFDPSLDRGVWDRGPRLNVQLAYLTRKARESVRKDKSARRRANVALIGAIVLSGVVLTYLVLQRWSAHGDNAKIVATQPTDRGDARGAGHHGLDWTGVVVAISEGLAICFPIYAETAFLWLIRSDHARRALRYPEIAEQLDRLGETIASADDATTVCRAIGQCEATLLAEVAGWGAFITFAGEIE